ncbi:FGGY family carbohydrate kinase [Poseidonocella sedimentorum]|uniref:ATP:glycerol 3-phosphotransferase n=1 Tax=Poseidonocella sedimentorum TaxID=871652 RepID=A0A1I6DHZ7_9RHOB|nr:FGGY family carbohydrate kinase [Poseidonocella sedimentorum]SFR05011.1 glycerol kinase [Poseidonocella sedimentorum]
MRILALDQGTTNTKALVVDGAGKILATASAPCATRYPKPGWAEQSAEDIWATTSHVIAQVAPHGPFDAIAIANQRETLVTWDAETGAPTGPAPLWQCRRSTEICAALAAKGHGGRVEELTGLALNPLFPASKLAWVLAHHPGAQALAATGRLRAGTVDSWLLWNLTGGAAFATDHSNASRTTLFDTGTLEWSAELAEIFGVPLSVLPEALASDARFGVTAAGRTALPAGIPILAIMGDSHAALYGHGLREGGTLKVTYGTGSSMMMPVSARAKAPRGLSASIAWTENGTTRHAIEANITVSGQAAAFAARMMGLEDAAALADLAAGVETADGVVFVPALAGLGAPYWDDEARGVISGLSLGTTPAHLARATFEAIAHQVADVVDALTRELGTPVAEIRADGGASSNAWLMQLQADILGCPVGVSPIAEVGALGVAAMAARALGEEVSWTGGPVARHAPRLPEADRSEQRQSWARAVEQARRKGP